MKTINLFITLLFIVVIEGSAQGRLALPKETIAVLQVFKEQRQKSKVITSLPAKTFFYVDNRDSLAGNYYKMNMSHIEEGLIDGYVLKRNTSFFDELPSSKQKMIFNSVFDQYLKMDHKAREVKYPPYLKKKERIDANLLNYITSVSPALSAFKNYYTQTKDTETLKKIFRLGEFADGEFGQTLSFIFFSAYMHDKDLFIKSFRAIKEKKIASLTRSRLIYGITTFLPQKLAGTGISPEESEKLVDEAKMKIEKL